MGHGSIWSLTYSSHTFTHDTGFKQSPAACAHMPAVMYALSSPDTNKVSPYQHSTVVQVMSLATCTAKMQACSKRFTRAKLPCGMPCGMSNSTLMSGHMHKTTPNLLLHNALHHMDHACDKLCR